VFTVYSALRGIFHLIFYEGVSKRDCKIFLTVFMSVVWKSLIKNLLTTNSNDRFR